MTRPCTLDPAQWNVFTLFGGVVGYNVRVISIVQKCSPIRQFGSDIDSSQVPRQG